MKMFVIAAMLLCACGVDPLPGGPPDEGAEPLPNASFESAASYDPGITVGWFGTDQGYYTLRSQVAFEGVWAVEFRNPADGYREGPFTLQSAAGVRASPGAEYKLGLAVNNPSGVVTLEVHWRDDLNQCAKGGDGACMVSRLTSNERAGGYFVMAGTVTSPSVPAGRTLYASVVVAAQLPRGTSAWVDAVVLEPAVP